MKLGFKVLGVSVSVVLGAVFLYSAFTKTIPLETFEYTIVEFLGLPWAFTAVLARILVGTEAALGILLVLNLHVKAKWVLKLSIVLLLLFSAYIGYLWATQGNQVNCGCFGDAIWMGPEASLLKNGMLLVLSIIIFRFPNTFWDSLPKFRKWLHPLSIVLFFILIIVPFIAFPMFNGKPDWLKNDGYMLPFTALDRQADKPAIDYKKGKHIIAFLSQRCPHCRLAAHKMQVMYKKDSSLPFIMVIGGYEPLDNFFKETRAEKVPHMRLDKESFIRYTGGRFPTILWLDNGLVVAKTNYLDLNAQSIREWMNEK